VRHAATPHRGWGSGLRFCGETPDIEKPLLRAHVQDAVREESRRKPLGIGDHEISIARVGEKRLLDRAVAEDQEDASVRNDLLSCFHDLVDFSLVDSWRKLDKSADCYGMIQFRWFAGRPPIGEGQVRCLAGGPTS
jgi:hypothetical protein